MSDPVKVPTLLRVLDDALALRKLQVESAKQKLPDAFNRGDDP